MADNDESEHLGDFFGDDQRIHSAWTYDALAAAAERGRQRAEDAQFLASMRAWVADGNPMPQLSGEGWAALSRALEREAKENAPQL